MGSVNPPIIRKMPGRPKRCRVKEVALWSILCAISCNRTVPDALRALQHHEAGLAWMPVSTTWKSLRKICNLHIFASQKLDANQHLRRSKVEQLLTDVRHSSRIGEAIEISTAVFKTSLNLLSNTVFSIDFADSSSHTALEFRETMQAFKEEFGKPNFSDFFPTLLAKLDLQGIRRRVTILFEKIMKLFDKEIEKRLELRKMNDYIPTNDFLDILLQISQDDNEELDRNLIKHLIFDLFTAGTDTATSTLEWAMAELLCNPKSLLEARRELQQIIGKGNVVAITEACKEAIWLKGLFSELNKDLQINTAFCDSQSAIFLTRDQMFHERTKHIDVSIILFVILLLVVILL
ncbi:hypothetical protein E1A91_D08G214000v1 [Gossypium mustelinum]|uniref:Cytochrome P450 n=1 Tax=Gossypium mustelinum TaxID=34275 RepID=A0A5D2TZV1_GOSMU|nr:hypothetical protein E1A91_D08G214000v1 [Gossypium mustelinum]